MLWLFHRCYSYTVYRHYCSHGTDTVAAKKLEEGTVTSRDTIRVSGPRCLPWYKSLAKDRLCLEELTVHRRQTTKEQRNMLKCRAMPWVTQQASGRAKIKTQRQLLRQCLSQGRIQALYRWGGRALSYSYRTVQEQLPPLKILTKASSLL